MGLFLERAGGRCFRGTERTSRAGSRDRSRSPGRTRVHPAYRPRSDLDDGATGPRLIRRILWGSALPDGDLATALRRSRSGGTCQAAWRRHTSPGSAMLRSSLLHPSGPKSLSLSLSHRYALPARRASAASNREGSGGDASRNDAASTGPATSSPGRSRGFLERKSWGVRFACAGWPRVAYLLPFSRGLATSKIRAGSVE